MHMVPGQRRVCVRVAVGGGYALQHTDVFSFHAPTQGLKHAACKM